MAWDGHVHKTFRGADAPVRFAQEVCVLRYLQERGCDFVPLLLEAYEEELRIVTTNCGARVEYLNEEKMAELFAELETFGVRHDDPFLRNITYRHSDGRFCLIDFELATILQDPEKKETTISWSGATHRGRVRPNNEDAFLALTVDRHGMRLLGKAGETPRGAGDFIFAVSDGMGGGESGEFASRVALDRLGALLPAAWESRARGAAVDYPGLLAEVFLGIHEALLQMGQHYAECRGMGATLTLAWCTAEGVLHWGHVGDTRLYHLPASGMLTQVSMDDTQVGWMRSERQLNEREARAHPARHALNRALGAGQQIFSLQSGQVQVGAGDLFLLCSDGVVEGLWDHALGDALAAGVGAESIIQDAMAGGSRDNLSAVVISLS